MSGKILMNKEVACWLVDNTTLTFQQISQFCGMHPLEIQALADREVGDYVVGFSPVLNGILSWEEIRASEADENLPLPTNEKLEDFVKESSRVKSRYTPMSHRQNRPDAIYYLVRNHPELTDAQICKLVHTTKTTVVSIRNRTHRSMADLEPKNPVILEMCSEADLHRALEVAKKKSGAAEPEPTEAQE